MKKSSGILGVVAMVGALVISARVAGAGVQQQETPKLQSVISGRVIDPNGTPAVGVRVVAITAPEARPEDGAAGRGIPNNTTLISLTRTDEQGNYELDGIPEGRYLLAIGTLEEPVYYPGVKTQAEASPVSITSGTTLKRDFELNVPLTHRISGRVIRDGHQAGTTVSLRGGETFNASTAIAPDGSFEFRQVRPGTYTLRIGPNLTAPAPVTVVVEKRDVSLEIPISHTAISTIPVTFELAAPKGAPLPRVKLNFVPMPSATQPSATVAITSPVHEQAMDVGAYRLNGLGDLKLPPGYTIRSIMAGPIDLTKTPFKVTRAGVPPVKITFAVATPPWVKVAGKITGLATAPVRATTVRVNLPGFITPVTAAVSSDGVFDLPYMRPGRHRVELEPVADAFSRVIMVSDAGTVDVRIPMVVTGVKVSGRIGEFNEMPTPAPITAWLYPEPVATGLQSFAAAVARDGTFTFGAVPPGRYSLMVGCEEPRGFRANSETLCPDLTRSRLLVPVAEKEIRNLVVGEDALTQRK